ncbi:MAG: carbohydrate kinase [Candidatus Heimdallarchaeota archaeon]|nr:carbohydrate kinase [Candidatus Heimdallarchaeota archaeon]
MKYIGSIGEVLIDFIAQEKQQKESVSTFLKLPGGAPANFAVGIARLGAKVRFFGKVSDDPFGQFLAKKLAEEGVGIENLVTAKNGEKTSLAFVFLNASGERSFLFYRENVADTALAPEELDPLLFEDLQYLHFGTISLLSEPSKSATFKAIDYCKKNGGTICFDPNLRKDLFRNEEEFRAILNTALQTVDILYPSEEELAFILGQKLPPQEAILEIMAKYPLKIVALKLGKEGCLLKSRDGFLATIPSFEVPVVDTTGAGDGFNAGFIFGLSQGMSLEEAGILGNAVGALVIGKKGAMTALPTITELKAFLTAQKIQILK